MLPQFEGETADEVWRQAATALLTREDHLGQSSRDGATRELLHCTFHIRDPRQRWVLSRQPPMNPAFAIAEVMWILQGREDAALLNFWNPALPQFAGTGSTYDGAYGHRLMVNFGLDQIERACQALTSKPDSRQIVLQLWDASRDLPDHDGSPKSKDIPCNVCSLLKIRDGRLEWLQVMRSNDLYRGTPYNFVQFTTLQEVMAGCIGVDVGSYVQISDSLHLYEKNLSEISVANQMPQEKNTDRLGLQWADFKSVLAIVASAIDELRAVSLVRNRLVHLVTDIDLPVAWRNLLLIVAADAARRRGWTEEMQMVSAKCSNPALNWAWNGWARRKGTVKDQ